MRFLDKVKSTIETYKMDLEPGEPVLVALSGGADSISLMLAMKELGYDVHALHVNHNLRGEEALRDERYCCSICSDLKIELEVASVDVMKRCYESKQSTETAARDLRYKAFSKNNYGIKKIVVAHNLNDSLETTIYNLTRGTSLNGLCGVAPVMYRKDLDIMIYRPLIECTRSEIEDFLAEKNVNFVTDSTNNTNDYTRNIIRNRVIPILAEINPSIVSTYGETVKTLRADNKYINDRADRLTELLHERKELDLEWIVDSEPALISRVLSSWLRKQYNIKVNRNILNNVIRAIETRSDVQISKTMICRASGDKLFIEEKTGNTSDESFEPSLEHYVIRGIHDYWEIASPVKFKYSTTTVRKIDSPRDAKNIKNVLAVNNNANIEIHVRHRRPGDKIKMYKRPNKTLKELFNSAKINPAHRDKLVVVESNGELIFVENFGTCDRYRCRQPMNGESLSYYEIMTEYNF